MEPKIWGPSAWVFLHLTSMSYPDNPSKDDIIRHKEFLHSFSKILPCNICRNHFQDNLRSTSIEDVLSSRENYIKFLHKVHNKVNKMNSKTELNYDEFIKLYQSIINLDSFNPILINNQNKKLKRILMLISILFLLSIIVGVIYVYKSKLS